MNPGTTAPKRMESGATMTKIAVEFPADFELERVLPIQLGRLYLGNHVVRIILAVDGKMKLVAPASAIADGSIVTYDTSSKVLYGL